MNLKKLGSKKFGLMGFLVLSALMTGCGVIETGNVGVRTTMGQISPDEEAPGFYTAVLSDVDEFTAKETSVTIADLTPKASDKLMLKDLDVTVFYETNGAKIADFVSARAGMSARLEGDGFTRPGYVLIDKLARGAASSAVSKFDSQKLHSNREGLEAEVARSLQEDLDKSDPGVFKVTRVNVSSLLTDSSVEDSIRKNAQAQNAIDAAEKMVQVKAQEALANKELAASLTPNLLQHEYIQAIEKCAGNPNCTLIVGSDATPMLNMK